MKVKINGFEYDSSTLSPALCYIKFLIMDQIASNIVFIEVVSLFEVHRVKYLYRAIKI